MASLPPGAGRRLWRSSTARPAACWLGRLGAGWPAVLCAGLVTIAAACGGPETGEGRSPEPPAAGEFDLIDTRGWVALSADEDPWRNVRPDPLECPRHTPHEEEGLLEFDTKICPHFAVERPLMADVYVGDRIRLVGSHSVLVATGNATGHLEVRIGDTVLFDFETAIPGPANVLVFDTVATADAGAGEMVRVHVRNHGANAWRINTLRATR